MILAQGGRFGGWSLYVKDGRPAYTYNFVGLQQYTVNSSERLAPARRRSRSTSPTTATAAARAAPRRISVNGKKVGSGRIEQTNANIFSADDAADVGVDEGTNVSAAYRQHGNQFTGRIEKVKIDVK